MEKWVLTKTPFIKIMLLLFADDTTLFSDSSKGLQEGIDDLQHYCYTYGLTINAEKTKVLVFRNGGRLSALDKFRINAKEIGIMFSTSEKFNIAQANRLTERPQS